jgi:hypothetical protein
MLLGPSELPSLTGQKLHGSAIRTDYGLRSRLGRLVRTKGMNSLKFVSNRSRPNNLKRRNEQGGSGEKVLSASSATLKLQYREFKGSLCTYFTAFCSALLCSPPRYFKVPALLLSHVVAALCQTTEF